MKSLKITAIGLVLFFVTLIAALNIRKESEKSLKKEEMITAVRNWSILSQYEALEKFEKQRQQAQEDSDFKRSLGMRD